MFNPLYILLATSLVLSRARVQSVWTAIALPTMTVVNHVSVLIGHRMSADTQYIEAKNDTSCIRSSMFWHIYANPEACLICALTLWHFYAPTVLFEDTLWVIIRASIWALHQATKLLRGGNETTNASRKGISKRRSSICSARISHWGTSCNHQTQWIPVTTVWEAHCDRTLRNSHISAYLRS